MRTNFKISGNTFTSTSINLRMSSEIKKVSKFKGYLAILTDDLLLYSKKESFTIKNVIYVDSDYFYVKEGKKIYRMRSFFDKKTEICLKLDCVSDEMKSVMEEENLDCIALQNERVKIWAELSDKPVLFESERARMRNELEEESIFLESEQARMGNKLRTESMAFHEKERKRFEDVAGQMDESGLLKNDRRKHFENAMGQLNEKSMAFINEHSKHFEKMTYSLDEVPLSLWNEKKDELILLGIFEDHVILKKNCRIYYKNLILEGLIGLHYKNYLVVVERGCVLFYDLLTNRIKRLAYSLKRRIGAVSLNNDAFLRIDSMLIYKNMIISEKYEKRSANELMLELIKNIPEKEEIFNFFYDSNFRIDELDRQLSEQFEDLRDGEDLFALFNTTVNSDIFSNDFVTHIAEQSLNLKKITETVVLRRGVKSAMEEIYLILVFYKISKNEFFYNLVRLRFGLKGKVFAVEKRGVRSKIKNGTADAMSKNIKKSGTRRIYENIRNQKMVEEVEDCEAKRILDIKYERLFSYDESVSIGPMVKKKKNTKKLDHVKRILTEKKIKFDEDDLGRKRKDAQNVRKGAVLGDALVFLLCRKVGKKRLADKLMNKNLTRLSDLKKIFSKNGYPLLSVIFGEKPQKLRHKTERRGPYKNERKKFYDFYYRLVHTYRYAQYIKTYTPMNDSLLELMLNGIFFLGSGTQRVKRKFMRNDGCKPEEIFFSEIFINCIDLEEIDVDALFCIEEGRDTAYLYRKAGNIFYMALWFLSFCEEMNDGTRRGVNSAREARKKKKEQVSIDISMDFGNRPKTREEKLKILEEYASEDDELPSRGQNKREAVKVKEVTHNKKETSEADEKGKKEEKRERKFLKSKSKNLDDELIDTENLKNKKREELTKKFLVNCLKMEEKMQGKGECRILFDYTLIALCIINSGSCDLEILRIVRRKILETKEAKYLNNDVSFFISCNEGNYVNSSLDFGHILKYKMCLGLLCAGLGNYKLKERTSLLKFLIISFYPVWPISVDDHKDFTECRYLTFLLLEKKPIDFKYRIKYYDEYDKKYRLDILSDYCEKNDESIERWENLIYLLLRLK